MRATQSAWELLFPTLRNRQSRPVSRCEFGSTRPKRGEASGKHGISKVRLAKVRRSSSSLAAESLLGDEAVAARLAALAG
jgi:hypothetical protein